MIIENYWENNWLYVFDASFALHPYFFLNKNKTNKYNYNKKKNAFSEHKKVKNSGSMKKKISMKLDLNILYLI